MKKLLVFILMFTASSIFAVCQNNPAQLAQTKTTLEEKGALQEIDNFFQNFKAKYSNIILRRQTTTPAGAIIAEYKNPISESGVKPGKQSQKVEVRLIKKEKQ